MNDCLRQLTLWLVLPILVGAFPFLCQAQAETVTPPDGKRVLLLLSNAPLFTSSPRIDDGFTQKHVIDAVALTLAEQNVVAQVRYLQSDHDLSPDSYKNFSWPDSDLIITAGDDAFSFMRDHRKELFGDVPWVFLGVSDEKKVAWAEAQSYVSGVYEAPPFIATLNLAMELFPSHKQIHIISDATPNGRGGYSKLMSLVGYMQSKPEFNTLNLANLSWVELKHKLEVLPDGAPILLVSAYKDSFSDIKPFGESLKYIVDHANGPVFYTWEHGLGKGVFGGVMINSRLHGLKAAEYALSVLSGEDIASMPMGWNSPSQPAFDQIQMDRFGIPVRALPDNSLIINPKSSAVESHLMEIIALIVIGILLAIVITILLFEMKRRKRIGKRLSIEKASLASLSDNTPDLVFLKIKKVFIRAVIRRLQTLPVFPRNRLSATRILTCLTKKRPHSSGGRII